MKTLKQISLTGLVWLIISCKPSPKPIEYGIDDCQYCKMTIIDKIHGSEMVTKKGKVYKFDAAECMIHFLQGFDPNEIELYLTNSFDHPSQLVDATQAFYLVSENLPSPMGEFLTAFKNEGEAIDILATQGGTLYNWNEIKKILNAKK
ncbi:nitrous oxide reductase accessory protein NosL [Aegicerativicinus sediminis]|uniref:nitrous oxide reductase accessory protein NosL n=1 Tax=Aegicerativicinus sediminis TaxID=2893202 RepID=UPI001E2C404B|nr:nitrous oxide reductase accessory protein NosL [Aegicerativicinus sediminis]